MKPKRKRITAELIRKYFPKSAEVTEFGGRFRVSTETGGDAVIWQHNITIICDDERLREGVTRLIGDAWGTSTIRGGGHEHALVSIAHAQAWGVPIRVDHHRPGEFWVRAGVSAAILVGSDLLGVTKNPSGLWVTIAVAVVVWGLMKASATHRAREEARKLNYPYPRVHGAAGEASGEDLEREGWT